MISFSPRPNPHSGPSKSTLEPPPSVPRWPLSYLSDLHQPFAPVSVLHFAYGPRWDQASTSPPSRQAPHRPKRDCACTHVRAPTSAARPFGAAWIAPESLLRRPPSRGPRHLAEASGNWKRVTSGRHRRRHRQCRWRNSRSWGVPNVSVVLPSRLADDLST